MINVYFLILDSFYSSYIWKKGCDNFKHNLAECLVRNILTDNNNGIESVLETYITPVCLFQLLS